MDRMTTPTMRERWLKLNHPLTVWRTLAVRGRVAIFVPKMLKNLGMMKLKMTTRMTIRMMLKKIVKWMNWWALRRCISCDKPCNSAAASIQDWAQPHANCRIYCKTLRHKRDN